MAPAPQTPRRRMHREVFTKIATSLLVCAMLSAPALAGTPQTSPSQPAAQSQPPKPASSAPLDPAKEAAIRQLLDVSSGTALVNQVMDGMQQSMKSNMASLLPPGEYRQKLVDLFFEKFRSKANAQDLMQMTAQIYAKYLSMDDIQGLIQFYSTPLGRKMLSVFPKVTIETQSASVKWGQEIGRQAMKEVLTEHPELAQAMQDAQRNARPQ